MIDPKERLKKEKDRLLSIFENTDNELFCCALKTVDGNRDALGEFLFLISELSDEAATAVLALVVACGNRINGLEKTISDLKKTIETYEEAFKAVGKEVS